MNREQRRHPETAPKLYSIRSAAEALSITPKHLYTLIGRGEIRSVKAGRRRFIAAADLDSYVERLLAQSEPA